MVVDNNQTVQSYFYYLPSGDLSPNKNSYETVETPHKFTGKEYDDEGEFDLYYFGSRYFDPLACNWRAVDPAGQLFSPYSYASGHLMNMTDPNGEFILPVLYGLYKAYTFGNFVYQTARAYQQGGIDGALNAMLIGGQSAAWGAAMGSMAGDVLGKIGGSFLETNTLANTAGYTIAGGVGGATSGAFGAGMSGRNTRRGAYQGAASGAAAGFLSSEAVANFIHGNGFVSNKQKWINIAGPEVKRALGGDYFGETEFDIHGQRAMCSSFAQEYLDNGGYCGSSKRGMWYWESSKQAIPWTYPDGTVAEWDKVHSHVAVELANERGITYYIQKGGHSFPVGVASDWEIKNGVYGPAYGDPKEFWPWDF